MWEWGKGGEVMVRKHSRSFLKTAKVGDAAEIVCRMLEYQPTA